MTTYTPNQRRYFTAAFEILAESGFGQLKLATLVDRVGVTTGPFYHAFRNWDGFTTALLDDWEAEKTVALARVAVQIGDLEERMEFLLAAVTQLEHRGEGALRIWAGSNETVADTVRRVDQAREAFVRKIFGQFMEEEKARVWSSLALNVMVGFEQDLTGQSVDLFQKELQTLLQAVLESAGRPVKA